MNEAVESAPSRRVTARGLATRVRIQQSADLLFRERGVAATSLADIRTASATSKSQFYQHFADKNEVIAAVIDHRSTAVLDHQRRRLGRVRSLEDLEKWRDELVRRNALSDGAYGCPLGTLAAELADSDEIARLALAESFVEWRHLLVDVIGRLKSSSVLRDDADPHGLATMLLAAVQGGYLIAKTTREVDLMWFAIEGAIAQVRTFECTPAVVEGRSPI